MGGTYSQWAGCRERNLASGRGRTFFLTFLFIELIEGCRVVTAGWLRLTGCESCGRDNQKTSCQLPVLGSQFVPRKPVSGDLRNLLAQGYAPFSGSDGHTVYLVSSVGKIAALTLDPQRRIMSKLFGRSTYETRFQSTSSRLSALRRS
jgi:hypothetical protein